MYKFFIFITLIIISCSVFAQDTIFGKISNEQGEPLPFAAIILKKNGVGTVSDINGDFKLTKSSDDVFLNDTLIVSYVGFNTKYIPVLLKMNKPLKIKLERNILVLKEFIISAKTYTGKEIISNAIKKIKDNYLQTPITIEGFYYEKISENNKWIQLNEAAFELSYSSYPQNNFQKKSFRSYYEEKYGADFEFTPGKYFGHSQHFVYHTPVKEQVKILSSRISQNKSEFAKEPAPKGGPLDLISSDKVKYLYDFLDPKNLKKYQYKLDGYTEINGNTCYIVQFHPNNKYDKAVFQPLNKKMKYAIYSGSCFVECSSLAIVGFECQFATETDFRVYKNEMPSQASIKVDYQQINNKWIIKEVKTKQLKHVIINGNRVSYYCERNLNLSNTIKLKSSSTYTFLDRLDQNVHSTLRYYPESYNYSFWKEYISKKLYIVPDRSVIKDLEKDLSLEQQFKSHFIPIDSISIPKLPIVKLDSNDMRKSDTLRWLENQNDTNVIQYLNDENRFSHKVFMQLKNYKRKFYTDMVNMFESDTSKDNNQLYVMNYNSDGNYYLYKKITPDSLLPILNYTEISNGKTNFYLEKFTLNSKCNKIVFTYSEKGNISKTLIIKDILSQKDLDTITEVSDYVWLNDSNLVYTKVDDRNRTNKIFSYAIDYFQNNLLYHEVDSTYDVSLKTSNSKKYVFIISESLDETEIRFMSKSDSLNPKLIRKRVEGVKYFAYHFTGDDFLIRTNENNDNYELAFSPVNDMEKKWNIKIKPDDNEILEDVLVTKDYFILKTFKDTKPALKCINRNTNSSFYFPFDEEFYYFDFEGTASFEKNTIEVSYESRLTPFKKMRLDIPNKKDSIIKEVRISETFNKSDYIIEQVFAKSYDDKKVPITIFYSKSEKESKGLILKAYGAYGAKNYPLFNDEDLVYVKNGFTIAYAHVRGGSDKGYDWYESGKKLNKLNTFDDYISCANFLIKKNYTSPEKLVGYGTSAGGLIMGYVANNQPSLFKALILDRPYLDVINTMQRDSLSLTTEEYKEWGDPNNKIDFDYISKYSPYQNIKRQKYPNMYFSSMYFDEQTPYWQIAKSVAMLRQNNTQDNLIIMNTNWDSGHRGSINWNEQVNKLSNQFAFIMYCLYGEDVNPAIKSQGGK